MFPTRAFTREVITDDAFSRVIAVIVVVLLFSPLVSNGNLSAPAPGEVAESPQRQSWIVTVNNLELSYEQHLRLIALFPDGWRRFGRNAIIAYFDSSRLDSIRQLANIESVRPMTTKDRLKMMPDTVTAYVRLKEGYDGRQLDSAGVDTLLLRGRALLVAMPARTALEIQTLESVEYVSWDDDHSLRIPELPSVVTICLKSGYSAVQLDSAGLDTMRIRDGCLTGSYDAELLKKIASLESVDFVTSRDW